MKLSAKDGSDNWRHYYTSPPEVWFNGGQVHYGTIEADDVAGYVLQIRTRPGSPNVAELSEDGEEVQIDRHEGKVEFRNGVKR